MSAYFERIDAAAFRPTSAVEGAWSVEEQHIAPSLGLIAHAIEQEHAERRGGDLQLGRISYDILGTIPIERVDLEIRVLRPGRTIELVEAVLSHEGRAAVIARAWLMQAADTAALAGSALPAMPGRHELDPWEMGAHWQGAAVRSVGFLRGQRQPGHAWAWLRPRLPLLAGEPISRIARMLGMVDFANGLTLRLAPAEVAFPNVDLTCHLFAAPEGEWIGFDTTVSVGPTGLGLTDTVLHDERGPVGIVQQILTVRPMRP
ncbi:MAG: thioesterase family protein [Actinobacteria bacterium]|nr:thioesterase family protein [Actinomycetota bacterium]